MYSNEYILRKLDADKYMSHILQKSVSETGKLALEQTGHITDGIARLSWYSSCFFKNYQDVCSKLAYEDGRFLRALFRLTKGENIIRKMIFSYIKGAFKDLNDQRIRNICRLLAKMGIRQSISNLSSYAFATSIASAIYLSYGLRVIVSRTISVLLVRGPWIMGFYGYVKIAAEAANRLKSKNHTYYMALYRMDLEMMYFIIEPLLSGALTNFQSLKKDEEIASDILRIIG